MKEEQLIGFYLLSNKKPLIINVKELNTFTIQMKNCYKISCYLAKKSENKNSKHKYEITNKLNTFYIGKVVQKSKVTSLKHFDFRPGEETVYIQLENGTFMQVSAEHEVIDSNFIYSAKVNSLFDENFIFSIN